MSHRDVARRAFLEQQLRRLHDRLGVEPRPHRAVQESVGDGDDRHALVVGHVSAHDRDVLPLGQARARVVQRLVEAVTAARADGGETGEVARCRARIDHGCERRRVGRDDGVLAETALQPEPGDAEVRVLIGVLEVAYVVGGLRDSPRRVERGAVAHLPADDEAARLLDQAAGRCAHHERRHQVLEHRARPGNERRAASDRGDGTP
jgi:hypothetical protein